MLFTGNHGFVNHVYLQNPPNIQVSTTDLNSPAAIGQNLTFLCLQTTPGLSWRNTCRWSGAKEDSCCFECSSQFWSATLQPQYRRASTVENLWETPYWRATQTYINHYKSTMVSISCINKDEIKKQCTVSVKLRRPYRQKHAKRA